VLTVPRVLAWWPCGRRKRRNLDHDGLLACSTVRMRQAATASVTPQVLMPLVNAGWNFVSFHEIKSMKREANPAHYRIEAKCIKWTPTFLFCDDIQNCTKSHQASLAFGLAVSFLVSLVLNGSSQARLCSGEAGRTTQPPGRSPENIHAVYLASPVISAA
jgi:hypothetical protein